MKTVNVVLAGLGGQGVIKASDVLSDAAFRAGYDIKKSEIHGMSQRGGSVCSDVRFGRTVLSPMVTPGAADFLVVLAEDQIEVNRGQLRSGGILITPDMVDAARLLNRKSLNVALLGVLSRHIDIALESWLAALRACFPEKLYISNQQAFETGRQIPLPRPGNPP